MELKVSPEQTGMETERPRAFRVQYPNAEHRQEGPADGRTPIDDRRKERFVLGGMAFCSI